MAKSRYVLLGLVQAASIAVSAVLRLQHWGEIDADPASAMSSGLRISAWSLVLWLATILVAIVFAKRDPANRSMIVLFLVALLPSIEFFAWFFVAF